MPKVCSVDGCDGVVWAKGLCGKHLQRMRFHGTTDDPVKPKLTVKTCSVDGCEQKNKAAGLCAKHYSRLRRHKTIKDPIKKPVKLCSIDGCGRQAKSLGFCIRHYTRLRSHGDPLKLVHRAPHTGCTRKDGYVIFQNDLVNKLAHVLVAEKAIGKPLPPGAVVHHIDGNPSNNAPNNLVICPDQGYHMLIHRRQTALENSGNANFKKCVYCKQYDDPRNMKTSEKYDYLAHHRPCANLAAKQRRINQQQRNQ